MTDGGPTERQSGANPGGNRPSGAAAAAGTIVNTNEPDALDEATIGIVAARDGRIVLLAVGLALIGDPLTDVIAVLDRIIGRELGDEATPVGADGFHTGGLWELLPRLDDLPDGFVPTEERVPAPFDAARGRRSARKNG